jgi:AcrR family transcriptional regulator
MIGRAMPTKSMTPNRRGLARREQILDAAMQLLPSAATSGRGLLKLAQRVGSSHVGILHHFGTKEELLRAAMGRRDERLAEILRKFERGRPARAQ